MLLQEMRRHQSQLDRLAMSHYPWKIYKSTCQTKSGSWISDFRFHGDGGKNMVPQAIVLGKKTPATECNQRNSIKVHTKHVVQPCLQTLRIQVSGPFLESSSNFCTVEGKLHASARNKTKIFRNMSSDPNNRCSQDDLAIDMLSGKSRACTLKVSTRILRCLRSFQLSTKSIRNFECSTTGRFAATPPHNLLQPKRSV